MVEVGGDGVVGVLDGFEVFEFVEVFELLLVVVVVVVVVEGVEGGGASCRLADPGAPTTCDHILLSLFFSPKLINTLYTFFILFFEIYI